MSSSLRICFVIGSRFPTAKAYGVTTRETVLVLKDRGFYTKIICNRGKYMDEDFVPLMPDVENFSNFAMIAFFIKIGEMGSKKINSLFWRIGLILQIIKSYDSIDEFKPDVIWVRDPYIAFIYLLKFKKLKIILEVHERNNNLVYKNLIRFRNRIRFCPINQSNDHYIKSICPLFDTEISPMGIKREFLSTTQDCENFIFDLSQRKDLNVKIGYVGRFAPGDYSKGIKELLDLAAFYSKNINNYSVTLVGAMVDEIQKLEAEAKEMGIGPEHFRVKAYIKHSDVFKTLRDFDILILPRYESTNYNGMPIKLLEYLAAGRITLIADTPLYRSLFKSNFLPFFYNPGNAQYLHQRINVILNSENLAQKINDGVSFASQFTWEKRVSRMLGSLTLEGRN